MMIRSPLHTKPPGTTMNIMSCEQPAIIARCEQTHSNMEELFSYAIICVVIRDRADGKSERTSLFSYHESNECGIIYRECN